MLEAFKKAFVKKDKPQSDQVYICDPAKNKECNKLFCGILLQDPEKCLCTKKKKYALIKEPVSVWDEDNNLEKAIHVLSRRGEGFWDGNE